MSQAVRDLPDPMEPAPALPASSPDDLLSQMADAEIDKLMAAADRGSPPPAPPAVYAEAATLTVAPPAIDSTDVAETAQSDVPSETTMEAAISPPSISATPAPDETPPPPAADVQALLRESPRSPSPMLLPLRLINAPFGWLSDGARRALGLIGLVTLVPAICAIIYVIYLKNQ